MNRPEAVHVINVISPSYTGTTWLNLVLGSHPRTFAIGPPDRVWKNRGDGWKDACRVHAAECTFWPRFAQELAPDRNFYLELARATERDYVVINNPSPEHITAELHHPDVIVHEIRMVRDGRALSASYARHQSVDFIDSIRQFTLPVLQNFPADFEREDIPCFRYEEVVSEPLSALSRISAAIGLEWTADSLEYYRFEHHMTSGNAQTLGQVRALQGAGEANFKESFYTEQLERIRAEGAKAFRDQRWERELGQRERYIFDVLCGELNRSWGYHEDRFSERERRKFESELADELLGLRNRIRSSFRKLGRQALPRLKLGIDWMRPRRRTLIVAGVVWGFGWLIAFAVGFALGGL